jgi:Ca-activated chloride channel family protein
LRIVNDKSGVAKLWARERIAALARQKNLGGDAKEAESQIVSLALEHHLVSDYTSLVAVDVTPVRPIGTDARQEQAPVSAPRGSPWATTGFAKTATPAPLLMLIGLAALGLAFVMFVPIRRRVSA